MIPDLLEDQFYVFPVIRVNLPLPDLLALEGIENTNLNRYLLSTLLSLEETVPIAHRIPLINLVKLDLDSYLKCRYCIGEEPVSKVLIFDQFEEILTLSPSDRNDKIAFFSQLGTALSDPNRWALFSMREDYVPALSPYLRPLPNQLNCTFRLDLLGIAAACQAIQAPAHSAGIDFTDAAVRKLVDDLRIIQVQQSDGTIQNEPGLYIEPVQLQVVCFQLWERKPKNINNIIDISDLETVGQVDQSLAEYYQSSVKNIVERTGVKEFRLREWFENKLIRPGKMRGQVPMGKMESDGLSNTAIDMLVDAHLVRGERHVGVTWFELAHDRLIESIQKNNAEWFTENLSLLQVQAALWQSQGRPERLLIRDNELQQGVDWATENEKDVTPIEIQFLDESRRVIQHEQEIQKLKLREEALQEKQKKDKDERRKKLIIGLMIGIFITIGLALTAFVQKQKALDRLLLAQVQLIDLRVSKMQIPRLGLSIEAFRRLQDAESYHVLWSSTSAFRSEDIRNRANGPVQSICFSDDGRLLVSETDRNVIQVWDSDSGNQQLQINPSDTVEYDAKVKVLCGPDGKIVSKEQNNRGSKILVWNMKTGTNLLNINQNDFITDFAISPDGKYIVSGSKDGHVVLLDVNTGQVRGDLWDDNSIESIIFSPNGEQIASANINGDVLIWNIVDKESIRINTGTTKLYLTFSPDSKWLVTGGKDGSVVFWESSKGKKQKMIYLENGISVLVYSQNGKLLYTASEDGVYKIWNTTKDLFVVNGSIYYGPISSASFSPNSEYIVHGGMSGYTYAYGFGKTDRMGQIQFYSIATTFGEGKVNQTAFSPDGKKFATASDNGEIIISPMTTGILNHDSKVWDIEFSKDKNLIVTSSKDGTARIWDTQTGKKMLSLKHNDQVNRATFNPDSSLIVTASSDHTAKVWRVLDGKEILNIDHNDRVADVKFSPDGKLVGSAGWDRVAQVWQISNQTRLFSISHSQKINRLLFSPNNKWVITASDDHSLQVWDLNDQKMLYNLIQGSPVADIAITSNNKYIVSGDVNGNIIVWDTQLGQRLFSINMGGSSIMKIAISPDDKLFAAGNEAGRVCVWQLDNGEEKLCFSAKQAVWDVIFSSSNFVIAGSLDGYAYIFDLISKQEYLRIGNLGMVLSLDISPDNRILAMSTTTGSSSIALWKKEDIIPEACKRLPRQLSEEEWKEYLGEDKYDPFCNLSPLYK